MRFRKDLGDLTDLKKSIKKQGLIHPIVKDSKGNLIAGARREQACKELGIEPEVRVIDFNNPQQAEIDENTCRKDFTPREIYEIGQFYKEKYSMQGKRNGSNGNGDFVRNPNEVKKPIKVVADFTGKSADTISKLNRIYESPFEEVKINLDLGKTSIDAAYKRVRFEENKDEIRKRRHKAAEKENRKWQRAYENNRKRNEAQAQREQEEIRKRKEENLKRKEENTMALKIIDLGYRAMATRIHPDKGGTNEAMHELQAAKQLLISYVEGASFTGFFSSKYTT
jgi:hypothetical protein